MKTDPASIFKHLPSSPSSSSSTTVLVWGVVLLYFTAACIYFSRQTTCLHDPSKDKKPSHLRLQLVLLVSAWWVGFSPGTRHRPKVTDWGTGWGGGGLKDATVRRGTFFTFPSDCPRCPRVLQVHVNVIEKHAGGRDRLIVLLSTTPLLAEQICSC